VTDGPVFLHHPAVVELACNGTVCLCVCVCVYGCVCVFVDRGHGGEPAGDSD